MAPISISIIYNKSNTYGLTDDIIVIERILKKMQDSFGPISKVKIVDMREPLTHSDINIHLEIPVFSAIPWAHTNILLVNPEQWSYVYDAYVHSFDALIFRDPVSAEKFRSDYIQMGISSNIYVVPWCNSWQVKDIKSYGDKNEFVCFIGGSTSKYEYIKKSIGRIWNSNSCCSCSRLFK